MVGTKVIVIYGPPAVGKLTVAMELGKITGYKVFHNHLTLEPVIALFDIGDKIVPKLVDKYRMDLIVTAAKERVPGVIITLLYGNTKPEDVWINRLASKVKRNGGKMYFVRLFCSMDELRKRLAGPDRKNGPYKKISDFGLFNRLHKKYNLLAPMKHGKSLEIDNTHLPPAAAAKLIRRYVRH